MVRNLGDNGLPTAFAGTLVRAPAAIGAGIEIQHVLPGKVFEFLYPEGFHLIQMLVATPHLTGLTVPRLQLREVDVEQRSDDVKVFSHRQEAEKSEEGQFMDEIGAEVKIAEHRQNWLKAAHCWHIHASDERSQMQHRLAPSHLEGSLAGLEQALRDHQRRNQRQNQNGFRRMIFAVFRRHCVARGFEDAAANRGDHYGAEKRGWRHSL